MSATPPTANAAITDAVSSQEEHLPSGLPPASSSSKGLLATSNGTCGGGLGLAD